MIESQMGQAYRQRLDEARDELSKDGWEVLTPERVAALSVPAQLIELEPDIVAMKGGELLIGEVKSRNSKELNDLNEFADAVALLPNTRFEVYWLGDEPGSEPPREVIREYVKEATVLLRTGHYARRVRLRKRLRGSIARPRSSASRIALCRGCHLELCLDRCVLLYLVPPDAMAREMEPGGSFLSPFRGVARSRRGRSACRVGPNAV